MRMTLLHRGRAHQDKAGAAAQFFNVPRATVAHSGSKSAYQLVNERGQRALVRHPSLDSFGDQLVPCTDLLTITVLGPSHHGPQGPHAAVRLEAAPLVNDRLAGALRQAGKRASQHDTVSTGRQRLGYIS